MITHLKRTSPFTPKLSTCSRRRVRTLLSFIMMLMATSVFALAQDNAADKSPAVPEVPQDPYPNSIPVPAGILDAGSEWLNTSGPIDLKDLRGKVVLLDFWTYCCINCMHVLPDLKYLEQKYANELVVIGVHSAKFDNEKLSRNIRNAILRYEIEHPVVNDSEMTIWQRFGTRAWPTLAVIDPEGRFVGAQGGEGNRELFDQVIEKLVTYHRAKGTLDERPVVFDLESHGSTAAPLRYPGKILADQSSGRLFIADSNHNRIVITGLDGSLQHVIGRGTVGMTDGDFGTSEFNHPQGMTLVDEILYVADTENHAIRRIDLASQQVTTLAGTGRQGRPGPIQGNLAQTDLNSPWDLCHIDGMLYIAMAGPHQIWVHRIGSLEIKVHAGNGREDIIDGPLNQCSFAQPSGLATGPDGTFFVVADSEGSAIRSVPVDPSGNTTTIAGTTGLPRGQSLFAFGDVDGTGQEARFQHPLGVAWHEQTIFVADSYNHRIRSINSETAGVTGWLGDGTAGDSVTPPQLNEPGGISTAGEFLYIADTNNHRICRVNISDRTMTVLEIPGLEPPQKPAGRKLPDLANAEVLPEQTVRNTSELEVLVELSVPPDHQLNELFPVTWEVFQTEGDAILAPEATAGRDVANVNDDVAKFRIPLSGTTGTATIAVQISYGYCGAEKSGVCRLGSATWTFPLTIADEADQQNLKLIFPEVQIP